MCPLAGAPAHSLILTLWSPPTTTQITRESVPFSVSHGWDVLFAHNLQRNLQGYFWYNREMTVISDQIHCPGEGRILHLQTLKVNLEYEEASGRFHIYHVTLYNL
ncbi:carcinoembryonic antigen-related cell adhesion molecule 6-like [Cavia porcellus]|uniref:carcinoembryonic antigen-related cell adhesion molecule 6-like n=1 Tax=Cavia porcellus TaxID=10141 RepID=UPI000351324A